MKPENKPAFPTLFYTQSTGQPCGHDEGMSLRDYFANSAMQGHLSSEHGAGIHCDNQNKEYLAKSFYSMADAMLNERNKEKENDLLDLIKSFVSADPNDSTFNYKACVSKALQLISKYDNP